MRYPQLDRQREETEKIYLLKKCCRLGKKTEARVK